MLASTRPLSKDPMVNYREKIALAFILASLALTLTVNSPMPPAENDGGPSSNSPLRRDASQFSAATHHPPTDYNDASPPPLGVLLPPMYNAIADVTDPPRGYPHDVPLFWNLPRSGGSTVTSIAGECLGLRQTTSMLVGGAGGTTPYSMDEPLRVMRSGGIQFVNADVSTPDGVIRAKSMGLVENRVADLLVTNTLHPSTELFNPMTHRGRLFALIRDPLERASSTFYHLKTLPPGHADHDPTLELFALTDWVKQRYADNVLTRILVGKPDPRSSVLTEVDLDVAKEVLRRKFLIGLLDEKAMSLRRFVGYFGWRDRMTKREDGGVGECVHRLLNWGWPNRNPRHRAPEEETEETRAALRERNVLDLELYRYARLLFVEQGQLLGMDGDALRVKAGVADGVDERDRDGAGGGEEEEGEGFPPAEARGGSEDAGGDGEDADEDRGEEDDVDKEEGEETNDGGVNEEEGGRKGDDDEAESPRDGNEEEEKSDAAQDGGGEGEARKEEGSETNGGDGGEGSKEEGDAAEGDDEEKQREEEEDKDEDGEERTPDKERRRR